MDNLNPINHKEDIESYQAKHESKEVVFPECDHAQIEFNKFKHELRCRCGVAYTGERLNELYEALTKKV